MNGFKNAADTLRAAKTALDNSAGNIGVFVGLDGFVDEIIHIVEKRFGYEADNYHRYEKMSDFGEKIKQASGFSANFEMMPTVVKLGGNGPIFANALLELGISTTYCGSIGYPDIHPVFKPMAEHPLCNAISVWEPAHTDALEFDDGKLIMGKMRVVYDITWESVKKAAGGIEKLAAHLQNSKLIGLLNWTMLPYMSDIWSGIINEALPLITFDQNAPRPYFFFDIADPAKRTSGDIRRALELMGELNKAFRSVLGLNLIEARQIAEVLGVVHSDKLSDEELARSIFGKLDVHCLVVHPTDRAFAITRDCYAVTQGPYCEKPVLTTGAGDNFNAGFCLGLLYGLDVPDSLRTGVSMSGFYVRNGRSAMLSDLTGFMDTI